MKPLYKTTIAIWTQYDPVDYSLEDLADDATGGRAYCSTQISRLVDNPIADTDWDGTEFFGDEDDYEDLRDDEYKTSEEQEQ